MSIRFPIMAVVVAIAFLSSGGSDAQPKPETKKAEKQKTIAMLVYPGFTALDLVGPHHVFSQLEGYKVQLVWKTTDGVTSDTGLTIKPTMAFKDCPEDVEVLFVPGGTTGTLKIMNDADVVDFLKVRAKKASYVTSVCTGSLVLGSAGLLRGYKATSHWGAVEILKEMEATPVNERVVVDRNRITGGGVTAGIDFSLTLAAKLKGEDYAKHLQLGMEYAPAPPFKTGTPDEAGKEMTAFMRKMYTPFVEKATDEAKKAKKGWEK
jgi:cyclohexyl-isocyanide hydratase